MPRGWVGRVKQAYASLGPKVTASRMVRDYVEKLYEPAATDADAAWPVRATRGKALASWRARVLTAWTGVKVAEVDAPTGPASSATNGRSTVGGGPRAASSPTTSPSRCCTARSARPTRSSSPRC